MCNSFKKRAVIFFLLLSCLLAVSGAQAGGAKEVVFYPTDVSDAGDVAYLRDSVRLMLASRIAPVVGGEVRLEKAMKKGRDFSSYRILSRVATTKNGIELSVKAFRPAEESSIQFQSLAKSNKEIMTALDVLVKDVAKVLFQVEEPEKVNEKTDKKGGKDLDKGSIHPDRIYKTTTGFGLSIKQDEFISEAALKVTAPDRYKSAVLPTQSKGMTAGDIDGDSLDEVLIVTNVRLYIYQVKDREIQHLDTISLPGGLEVHALNVADLNNNGVMEIYISATRKEDPTSFVMEWQPEVGVEWLHKEIPLYLRPLIGPKKTSVLAGQRGGLDGELLSGIYRLSLQGTVNTSAGELLPVPDSVNLFEFVFADLEGDGVAEVVSQNRKEELKVFGSNSELLYTSPPGFGGKEHSEGLNRPIRLVVADFNLDGMDDILLVDNELWTPKMMKDSKYYENGQVRGLLWDKDLFLEMWRSNIFQKSIVDFQFLVLPETEENGSSVAGGRLFVIEPAKGNSLEGLLLGTGATRLSVFGMKFVPKAR